MLKLNRKIKRVCATLRNGHMAKKNYVMVKDLSIVVTDFLSFLKRSGLILSFNLEDSFYKIIPGLLVYQNLTNKKGR